MRTGNGYTLIETCLALGIGLAIITLIVPLINLTNHRPDTSTQRQNFIGVIQLRQTMSLGREFKIEGDALCMEFNLEDSCFYVVNGMVIQTPGTQAYLIGIQDAEFRIKDGILSLIYVSESIEYEIKLIELVN